ncbi:MAG: hypothetical protein CMG57_09250 [Candidatus Marinimicrobia bacterium]|nr:hypothetical protein [Candidatus Neomarinimicrobiota bacterium]
MIFQQRTVIKNKDVSNVISSFEDENFLKYLTFAQPVKIVEWNGIDNGKKASFLFWFFGWRKISVTHMNYVKRKNYLFFTDVGNSLPFGLNNWEHHHIVKTHYDGSIIIDKIFIDTDNLIKKYFFTPIMLFPILIRKITYKLWFYLPDRKK